jgi:broad specificity phosphatase PhoE
MNFSILDSIDQSAACIIMVRHAERYDITSLESHHEVLLTPKGIDDSVLFGKRLGGKSAKTAIYHSPLSRCRQTAEGIAKGINDGNGKADVVGALDWLLGEYMFDKKTIDEFLKIYDVNRFLRDWFDGKLSSEIISPIDEIAPSFMDSFREQFAGNGGLIVDVSHDWNMSVMLEYFMGLKHENIGIPVFLDHIIFRMKNGRINMTYHEYDKTIGY